MGLQNTEIEVLNSGGLQNLRNKYYDHPVIKPLIKYCEEKGIGFEFIKDTRFVGFGKSFNFFNKYYMKIGENLIIADENIWGWDDLFKLIVKAYKDLNLEYPDNLVKAAKAFKRSI